MSNPVILVRQGFDVVPVLAGLDQRRELVGFDVVRGQFLSWQPQDVLGAVNIDPAAVYWGLDLKVQGAARSERAAAEAPGMLSRVERWLNGPQSVLASARPHLGPEPTGRVPLGKFVSTFLRNVKSPGSDERRIVEALQALGLTGVGEILGAGSFGTAAVLDDETIIKLTSDPTEVQAGFVLQGKRLPHVARVELATFVKGVEVGHHGATYPVGILYVERVKGVPDKPELDDLVAEFKDTYAVWPDQLEALGEARSRERLRDASKALSRILRDEAADLHDVGNDRDADMCDDIAAGLDELRGHGVFAIDVHSGNVGYKILRGHRHYKIFDIGSSSPPRRPRAPAVGSQVPTGATARKLGIVEESVRVPFVGEAGTETMPKPAPPPPDIEARVARMRAMPPDARVSLLEVAREFILNVEAERWYDEPLRDDDRRIVAIVSALKELGFHGFDRILGKGSYGVAATLPDDQEKVVKITADPSEVQTGFVLIGKESLPNVVTVYQSVFVRGATIHHVLGFEGRFEKPVVRRMPVGILVVERVNALPPGSQTYEDISKIVRDIKRTRGAFPHHLAKLGHERQREKLKSVSEEVIKRLRRYADDGWGQSSVAARGAADALSQLREHGIYAIDAHGGNIGNVWDADAGATIWKLFDIGSSSPPREPAAPQVGPVPAKRLTRTRVEPEMTQLELTGMLKEAPAVPYVGGKETEDVRVVREAAKPLRYGPQGIKFTPIAPKRLGGDLNVTGYPEVRPTLLKHREHPPTVETIRLSMIFAMSTIRVRIEEAENRFRCILDLWGDKPGAPIEPWDEMQLMECFRGLQNAMADYMIGASDYAPTIHNAIAKRKLRDRELRRHLALETKLPKGLGMAKLSFTLALMGQDAVCLDTRIMERMFGDEALKVEKRWGKRADGTLSDTQVDHYERVEDAFLDRNPFYRQNDPIGRARAQWMSWESVGEQAATHSTWLDVVKR